MLFRPRQKTLPITRQIIIENNVLEQVDNIKFLEFILISTLHTVHGKLILILLQLRFLNLSGYFIKLNTIGPQNLFLHYTMHLFIHILLTATLILASTNVTNLKLIYILQKRAVQAD